MNSRHDIKRLWLIGIVLILLSLSSIGCMATLPQNNLVGPKTYKNTVDIRLNGFRRSYLVHIPSGYHPDKPLPLVVVIHGAFDTARNMEKVTGFSELADREGFIVLYPNGFGILGYLQHWNAGHCCGKAADDNIDDVGFIVAAIEDVCDRLSVDRSHIYMVGFSNGGMLTYRFAAERGDLLAAAAPLAASIGGRPSANDPEWHIPEPIHPVSIICFHGLKDDKVRYGGGVSQHRKGNRSYWSVNDSINFWVRHNGCNLKSDKRYLLDGSIYLQSWTDCKNDSDIALYLIKKWGHFWPGKYFTTTLSDDNPIKDFDAAEIIWNFFKSHPKQP